MRLQKMLRMNKEFNLKRFLISILITEGSGVIGSLFTINAISGWYATLAKTPVTPPNWLFAPMWVTLYFLMGVALYIVWNKHEAKGGKSLAYSLFVIQLALNVLWSVIFFWQEQILFAAIEIVFMWFFIVATIIEFRSIDKSAGYILFPYLAWVTIATVLNFAVLFANQL